MEKHHQIVIIGAGTAGITVAAQLLRKDRKLDIAIIDPAKKHYYQAAWTLVGAGTFNYKSTEREMASLIPKGATWIQEAVQDVDPDANKVTLKGGDVLTYDYLVACPGIQYNLNAIEGLAETINKNNVCSNYIDPNYTWEVLQKIEKGTALFTLAPTTIKCGGAPQKIMYLADDYFRRTRKRDKIDVTYFLPGGVIFGVEPFKSTIMKVVDRKDIQLRFFHALTRIDGPNHKAYFKITANQDDPNKLFYHHRPLQEKMVSETEVEVAFDMLHLAPPQSAPDFIMRSKIAAQEGPQKGWINVNLYTLQHNVYANVFALGDAAGLPTGKTGAAIRKQAPIVVENLLHVIKHDGAVQPDYHGYSSCPIVTGYGKMVLAEFDYENKRASDPMISRLFDTSKELFAMWILKKYGLPFMYWNLMLKGKA